jgi:hypothetical protein
MFYQTVCRDISNDWCWSVYTTWRWHGRRVETRSGRIRKIPLSERDLGGRKVSKLQAPDVSVPSEYTRRHAVFPGECGADLQLHIRSVHISLRLRWSCLCETDLSDCVLKFCLLFNLKEQYVSARISFTSHIHIQTAEELKDEAWSQHIWDILAFEGTLGSVCYKLCYTR